MRKITFRRGLNHYGRFKVFAASFCILFIIMILYVECRVAPFMRDYTCMKGRQMMTELFSETVNSKMSELNLSYENLTNIAYSNDGKVQTLNTDVVTVNRLKNEVTAELSQLLSEKYDYVIDIPIGSMFNSEFLSGSGKGLQFNNTVTGDVTTDFRSELEDCGINQTIHRLYIDIHGELLIIAGGNQEPIELDTSVLVGETVLVGNVPSVKLDK